MNDDSLKWQDTMKEPPLRILSLDGGGVRGYSMLIIIQELMHRTYVEVEGRAPRRQDIPKPCDHFDLICGTGTGGLIAIMLGRLRLDLETCKEVYVRMTKRVFETDKTIAGIPYRSTLFKASKLEEAIRECVREHTIFEKEGKDVEEPDLTSPVSLYSRPDLTSPTAPGSPASLYSRSSMVPQRAPSNASVASFSARGPQAYSSNKTLMSMRWGNPNALLYDSRKNRTKTAVTAIYAGTPKGGSPAILRSYDSRKEPSPEFECTIWQAGRATCATGLAFKPIQIGQSKFIDEGAGQYNPSPLVLDEAVVNEWPGREVGVFVSVGTGKRPAGSDSNQHLWYEDFMGEFAEARRRLISKIEGCEETHQYMMREYLAKHGVDNENYYRLNVEIGVGEFGMNEWNRLADISTGTRRYLGKSEVQRMNHEAAAKLAKIYIANAHLYNESRGERPSSGYKSLPDVLEVSPIATELPAEVPAIMPLQQRSSPPRPSYESGHHDTLEIPGSVKTPSPRSSSELPSPLSHTPPKTISSLVRSDRPDPSDDKFIVNNPTPNQYRTAGSADKVAITSPNQYPRPKRAQAPPIPPKTPISEPSLPVGRGRGRPPVPYPLDDGPPPVVNMARKPEYKGR